MKSIKLERNKNEACGFPILLAYELIQAIKERNVCTKFNENCKNIATARARTYIYIYCSVLNL